ncbi:hypothetical protein LCGC14_2679280 [marine sediment metagenome]|uniref:Uncharacterized protein n=1 Tax=marine sediment metagenome TaxID=412755 RepID=A0A0F8ZLR8_9ZZZZ
MKINYSVWRKGKKYRQTRNGTLNLPYKDGEWETKMGLHNNIMAAIKERHPGWAVIGYALDRTIGKRR